MFIHGFKVYQKFIQSLFIYSCHQAFSAWPHLSGLQHSQDKRQIQPDTHGGSKTSVQSAGWPRELHFSSHGGLAWKPCPLYPFTFVLAFRTGLGTDCATLVRVERRLPAEGGQMERNWVKNLPRWGVFQLWWDNSFHVLWDLHQIIPHIWNNGRPKHWEEPALHCLSRFQ